MMTRRVTDVVIERTEYSRICTDEPSGTGGDDDYRLVDSASVNYDSGRSVGNLEDSTVPRTRVETWGSLPLHGVRKWQSFPGRNKFYCDGRLMLSQQSGIFYFTCFLIVSITALFFIFDCPYLTTAVNPAVPVVAGVLFFFVMSTLLRTAFSDPGIIPRATTDESEDTERRIEQVDPSTGATVYRPPPRIREVLINNQIITLKYCFTCKIFRPPRASHCSICDNCVERFDHHCPWVGNCIGRRNYRYFYLFLVFLSLHCIVILCLSITTLVLKSLHQDFITALKESPTSLIEAIIAFLSVWSVFGLAGFHTYLASCNITTNEDIKQSTNKTGPHRPNIYSRGSLLGNYCEVICSPVPPSLIDRRGYVSAEARGQPAITCHVTDRNFTPLSFAAWSEQNSSHATRSAAVVGAWGSSRDAQLNSAVAAWGSPDEGTQPVWGTTHQNPDELVMIETVGHLNQSDQLMLTEGTRDGCRSVTHQTTDQILITSEFVSLNDPVTAAPTSDNVETPLHLTERVSDPLSISLIVDEQQLYQQRLSTNIASAAVKLAAAETELADLLDTTS